MIIHPENIVITPALLAIAWSDGEESFLDLENLRRACPCANCQGEPDALGRVVKPLSHYSPLSFKLDSWEPVGGYAIRLVWADRHSTGLYTFDLLRKIGKSGN